MTAERPAFVPNPLLAGLIGMCPIVAADRSLPEGLALGIGAAFCSLLLGILASPMRGAAPDRLRPLFSLALATAAALLYSFGVRAYSPALADSLGIYLPLLAVSATSLHTIKRGSSPGDQPAGGERLGSIAMEAAVFLAAAAAIGGIRELLGQGSLTIPLPRGGELRLADLSFRPIGLLSASAGGFILLGFLAAAYRLILRKAGRRIP